MKYDLIVAGVGGQGVLSVGAIIAASAERAGLHAVQSEVHGMSQRGGAVVAHLRISDAPIHACTISRGEADLVLSMEPLESLRYTEYLAPNASVITSTESVRNIADYPPQQEVFAMIRDLPRSLLIDAGWLAREAGAAKAANSVMVGAAAYLLPIPQEVISAEIEEMFRSKGPKVVEANLEAFRLGQAAAAHENLVNAFDPVTA